MNLLNPQTPYDSLVLLLAEQEGELNQNWQGFQEWAVAALESGMDTPSLRILAGINPAKDWEVRDYLECATRELGWNLPGREELLYIFARKIAALMVARKKPLAKGCRELYRIFNKLRDRYANLNVWLHYDDEFDLMEAGILNYPMATLEQDVLQAAAELANDCA